MGGPNTPKLFSLFTLMVICFFVGNLYQISADSKIDGDLIFDSNDKHPRLLRHLYKEDVESKPPVEEHWLTSTVNRLRRSINSVFSKDTHNEKLDHHHVEKKSNHHRTKFNAFKKPKFGRKHREADDGDKDYDDGQSQYQVYYESGNAQEGQFENEGQGQIEQDEDESEGQFENDLTLGNNDNYADNDGFAPLKIGEATEDSNYDLDMEYDENGNDNGDDNYYNNGEVDTGPTDDEDIGEISGDRDSDYGSGDIDDRDYDNVPSTTTYSVDQGHPRIYRVAFTIQEPYQNEYQDRNSQQFKTLEQRIKRSLENVLQGIPGELFISVISLEKSQDLFKIRVTIDIDFEGNAGSDDIKRAIFEPIHTNHRLGDLTTTNPEDLRFIEFGAEGPHCSEDELKCGSGQCVANSLRCNGVNDCNDGSDEEGCVYEPPKTEPPVTESTTLYQPNEVFVTTTTTQVPVTEPVTTAPTTTTTTEKPSTTTTTTEATTPYEEPEPQTTTTTTAPTTTIKLPDEPELPFIDSGSGAGECRADDSVRCSDGSRVICADQVCDGIEDCDNGADEDNCGSAECRQGEFKCDVYRCIPISQHCDGKADCTDGTDEHNCQKECNDQEFACDDQCLSLERRCDGIRDCMDNTDETNCPGMYFHLDLCLFQL